MRPILPNAVLLKLCSIRAPRRPYGQTGDFSDLSANASPRLRKVPSFSCFHRSRSLSCIRKKRFRFAINCKSTGFSLRAIFSSSFKKIFSIFHFAKLVPQHGLDAFFAKIFLIYFSFNDVSARLELESFRNLAVDFVRVKIINRSVRRIDQLQIFQRLRLLAVHDQFEINLLRFDLFDLAFNLNLLAGNFRSSLCAAANDFILSGQRCIFMPKEQETCRNQSQQDESDADKAFIRQFFHRN